VHVTPHHRGDQDPGPHLVHRHRPARDDTRRRLPDRSSLEAGNTDGALLDVDLVGVDPADGALIEAQPRGRGFLNTVLPRFSRRTVGVRHVVLLGDTVDRAR